MIDAARWALTKHSFQDLGEQLPGYFGGETASTVSVDTLNGLGRVAREKFFAMDMFFVKV